MEPTFRNEVYGVHGKETEYLVENGELKWGRREEHKFEFVIGGKYQVCHNNPAMMLHKNAVGIYLGLEQCDFTVAVLDCCGKKFRISPSSLVPYDGEITAEHIKLISLLKKMHFAMDGKCACNCEAGAPVDPERRVSLKEFMMIPDASRCTNCNHVLNRIAKLALAKFFDQIFPKGTR